ncbi:hypothetical protein EI42_02449 [Thermosporothrix hazakensis]|jgi:hypothetical protein|uniref:Uncharacterized protein n=1 Tax=Thermosporothrix hazakensis TaxID=644383 RepID=A0A326UB11_THEHA|nr:hypothetical protein [Thermosporothrix hazakensis]PZW30481.1 hypothetical protein EI42_02449 [Thermosporothrix hazakensis]
MTRDFSKSGREDKRPPRDMSTNQYRNEQQARPTRVRLSREVVDRGWALGAQNRHADYQPRNNGSMYPYQNGRTQSASSSNNGYGSSRRGQRPQHNHANPVSPHNNYQSPFSSNPNSRGQTPRDSYQKPRKGGYTPYHERSSQHQSHETRYQPPYGGQYQDRRPSKNAARFEGDYESFTHTFENPGHSSQHKPTHHKTPTNKPPRQERHTTQLSSGRVLKGSRPAQRKQARFWQEIEQDTAELLQGVRHNKPENSPSHEQKKRAEGRQHAQDEEKQ